jgi:hypothetical protein
LPGSQIESSFRYVGDIYSWCLTPTKIKNPASYPEAEYLLVITHYALPFWLKVEAIKKMVEQILTKLKGKIKNFK